MSRAIARADRRPAQGSHHEEARGHGLHLRHLEQERGTLEEIYLQLADAGGASS
jgi:hypothetical protein